MKIIEKSHKLKLCAFWHPPGIHSGGWRMPGAIKGTEVGFEHYVRIVHAVERGKMDAIFFQDSVSMGRNAATLIEKGDTAVQTANQVARIEPMTLLSALAAVTTRVGLIATGTTTFNEPYNIARKYASIDLLSGGRAGWNLVTSVFDDEAQNFGSEHLMDHEERYRRASEFYDIVAGLWDSWDEGALVEDKESGTYFDMQKVHVLNHSSTHFKVRGPLNVARSPQGRPIVAQAGSSEVGMRLAARTADCVFTAQTSLKACQTFYRNLKSQMGDFGRNPDDLKILPGILPIVGRTESEAKEHYLELQSLIPDSRAIEAISFLAGGLNLNNYPLDGPLPELPPTNAARTLQQQMIETARKENLSIRQVGRRFAESRGHRLVWGTPEMIADAMQEWNEKEACDGFMIMLPYYPRGVNDFVDLVIPELQRRKIFRTEYEGKTLRENLGVPFPKSRYGA
jgi:FMN-dependent oxidoreductase (nitrilotriacetate monooxygenase family)